MLIYPHLNPIAFSLGPLKVHWYGLMYLLGIVCAWILGVRLARQEWRGIKPEQVGDILFYGVIGLVVGGRLGYMLFYDTANFFHHPWIIVQVWDGGMSFHGGLIGAIVGALLFAWRHKLNFFTIMDFFAPLTPIGLAAGRIGNFINAELWGRVTDSKIGMIFPTGGPLPRYPSQLIECLLEGVVLFIFLMILARKPKSRMVVSAWFLIGYAIARFISEFFRQPDPQRGYVLFGWMTEGQLLSVPMLIIGAFLLMLVLTRRKQA